MEVSGVGWCKPESVEAVCCCTFSVNNSTFTEKSAEWAFASGLEACTSNSYS